MEEGVGEAVRNGAHVLTGGNRPTSNGRGFFFEPTVIESVPRDATLMTEEIFGPVIPIAPYDSFDEAISLANDSNFGLAASLMTQDAALAMDFMNSRGGRDDLHQRPVDPELCRSIRRNEDERHG